MTISAWRPEMTIWLAFAREGQRCDMAWCTTVRAMSERSDSMLEMHGEGPGCIAINFPHCEENPWDKKCRDVSKPPVPGSERDTLNNLGSIARVGRLFPVPRSQLAVTLARKS